LRVHWTNTATEHLVAIYEYIARDSQDYALRMVDRITARSEQVAMHPQSGRMVPEYQHEHVREVIESPYRIIYRILEDRIDVVAVLHGARLIQPEH